MQTLSKSRIAKYFSRNTLARNSGWMLCGQGVRLVVQALYFIEIARALGANNYGAFVSVAALVGIAFPFGAFGTGHLLVKNVSRNSQLFPQYWGWSLFASAFFGSVLLGIVLLISRWALGASIPLALVVLVGAADIFGMNFVTVAAQAFQAFERLNWTAAIWVLFSMARLAGALTLVGLYSHPSALEWAYLYFFSTALVAVGSVVLACLKLGRPRFLWRHHLAELKEGFYFSASVSAMTIYNDIDKAMLGRLDTLTAAGIYGAAYRLVAVGFVPVTALLNSAYPRVFRAGAAGIGSAFRYTKRLLLPAIAYSLLASIALFLVAGLIPYVLGAEYAPAVEALRWLAVLPLLRALHFFLSDTLAGSGYQGLRCAIQAAVAAFNVLINLWLIPAYSWRGAAWSSVASDALLAAAIAAAVVIIGRRSPSSAVQPLKLPASVEI